MYTITCHNQGLDFDVEFAYDPGFKGNREEPPEPETIELSAVFLAGTEIDLMDHLSGDVLRIFRRDALVYAREERFQQAHEGV